MSAQPESLFEICESCANGRIATHSVYFRDGGPTFLTCRSCADDADGGLCDVLPISRTARDE